MKGARVLVVDADPAAPDAVRRHLREPAIDVVGVPTALDAMLALERAAAAGAPFTVVLLDWTIGAEIMERLRGGAASVVVTAAGDGEAAIEGMHHGAFDFLGKPWAPAELKLRVERALRERTEPPGTRVGARRPRKDDLIIGGSAWTKELYERISMVAPTDVTVFISGESGTGKELVARTIHNLSARAERPFVVVNCGAIPESLLEDELFGHVRGAFTDATKDREGLFAAADGGSIFLDEIGELPGALQVKLLRVLQSQEFRRIGDDRDTRIDVRVITATNRNLEHAVAAGAFRQDLYYRINVFPLAMKPLRDRRDDIPLLAHHFLLKHRGKVGKKAAGFTPSAMDKLLAYDWPGNVRELENKVHHALVLAQEDQIQPEEVQLDLSRPGRSVPLDVSRPFRDLKREVLESFEREYARELLRRHQGNLAAAAREARIDRKNLWSLAKKYRIDLGVFRRG